MARSLGTSSLAKGALHDAMAPMKSSIAINCMIASFYSSVTCTNASAAICLVKQPP